MGFPRHDTTLIRDLRIGCKEPRDRAQAVPAQEQPSSSLDQRRRDGEAPPPAHALGPLVAVSPDVSGLQVISVEPKTGWASVTRVAEGVVWMEFESLPVRNY